MVIKLKIIKNMFILVLNDKKMGIKTRRSICFKCST